MFGRNIIYKRNFVGITFDHFITLYIYVASWIYMSIFKHLDIKCDHQYTKRLMKYKNVIGV
jgi:hypothetical protein